jgi:hypothetical protein
MPNPCDARSGPHLQDVGAKHCLTRAIGGAAPICTPWGPSWGGSTERAELHCLTRAIRAAVLICATCRRSCIAELMRRAQLSLFARRAGGAVALAPRGRGCIARVVRAVRRLHDVGAKLRLQDEERGDALPDSCDLRSCAPFARRGGGATLLAPKKRSRIA